MVKHAVRSVGALLVGLGAIGCEEPPAFEAPPPPEVTVQLPQVDELTTYKEFTGRVEAQASVEVRARAQGYLQTVEFEPGEIVQGPAADDPASEGDLLFTIERAPFEARLNAAEAALAQAVAARDLAKVKRDRTERASEQGAANALELVEREADLEVAEADVLQAEAEVESARIDLGYTTIHSPLTGRISRALVDPGNLVGAGDATLLTTIVKDDPIYAYVDVSERELLGFVEGGRPERRAEVDRLDLFLETADGRRHRDTGHFDFAETRLDAATGTLQIRSTFPNSDGSLYPGMFVRVLVPEEPGQKLLVPEVAVQRDLAGSFVYVVVDSKVERRTITLGRLVGERRIVASGLEPDEQVIVNGVQRVFPGATVNARADTSTGAAPSGQG